MKTFKIVDLWWQVLALVAAILVYVGPNKIASDGLFVMYFMVGGAQLFSFLIHLFFAEKAWYHKKDRIAYGKVIIWTFLLGLLLWFLLEIIPALTLIFFGASLFVTPFFAIWYFSIGLTELRTMRNKELVHLK
jgi:hypothetical protein